LAVREQDWSGFDQWHRLLDELCNRRGHIDNAQLASRLCRRQGRNGQEGFDAADKSLRNWRLGRHVPLRRNFMFMSELLDVASDADLARHWNRLYAAARGRDMTGGGDDTAAAPAPGIDTAAPARRRRLPWIAAAVAAATLAAGGFLWLLADPYGHLPMVGYSARVVMAVGESRLIHGDRGDCDGGRLPDWYYTRERVPVSGLGTFSDGGLARKMANDCDAVVPVRAVRFTAEAAGVDEVRLLEDYIKIVVIDPRRGRLE